MTAPTTGETITVVHSSRQHPISDAQLAELQSRIRNKGAGREIHDRILAALNGDSNARWYCAGVWETMHGGHS